MLASTMQRTAARAAQATTLRCVRALSTSVRVQAADPLSRAQAAMRELERAEALAMSKQPASRKAAAQAAALAAEADEDDNEYANEYDEDDDVDYDGEEDGSAVTAPQVSRPAPDWTATALMPGGEFKQLSSEDFAGKWQVLFFYPLDFTFVCPTEIRAFSDRNAEFEKLGVSVIGASVDSEYSHLAWTQQPKENGGLGPMNIPLLADITKSISRSYGVLLEKQGISLRGLFIIDPQGNLRQSTVNDLPIGRSVDETLRLIQALQHHEQHGEVCPAGWTPGKAAMTANTEGLKAYFKK